MSPLQDDLTIDKRVSEFTIKLHFRPDKCSVKFAKVAERSIEAVNINNLLDGIKAQLQNHYFDLKEKEKIHF